MAQRVGNLRRMNDEAFPHDSTLPQLAVAVDGVRMCEVFRQHLRPRLGRAYEVQECRLARARCRRGDRGILQYDLRVTESASGQELHQTVKASFYVEPGRARHLLQTQLGTNLALKTLPGTLPFEPFAFVPELEMFVEVFPYDRHLPALPQLVEKLPVNLPSVLLERLGAGAWRIAEQSTETIRYRAGLGATLRYDLVFRNATTSDARS